MQAHLLAGRLALSRGRATEADRHLERAARSRRRGPPLTRSVAWLARALQADARGNARATAAACARGLDALREHQLTLGATELRAYGTAHGAELATLAQRDALRGATSAAAAALERALAGDRAGRPEHAARHDRELGGRAGGAPQREPGAPGHGEMAASRRTALERERRRLEAAVQARTRRSPGPDREQPRPGRESSTWTSCSTNSARPRLVEIVEVDDVLHVIVVAGRRMRRHTVGGVPGP